MFYRVEFHLALFLLWFCSTVLITNYNGFDARFFLPSLVCIIWLILWCFVDASFARSQLYWLLKQKKLPSRMLLFWRRDCSEFIVSFFSMLFCLLKIGSKGDGFEMKLDIMFDKYYVLISFFCWENVLYLYAAVHFIAFVIGRGFVNIGIGMILPFLVFASRSRLFRILRANMGTTTTATTK